jgi:SAM-dependent methyltransferase
VKNRLANDSDRDWESLAKIDPYYAVLTADQYRTENLDAVEFFATGKNHIAHMLERVRTIDPDFSPRVSLDFGCGVGRLLIPLSEVSGRVIGVDISSTMLATAEANLRERHISNVELIKSDDALSLVPNGIDFLHSFIVFQHIPVTRGEQMFSILVDKLVDGGMGAVHFTYHRYGPSWRKLAASATKKFNFLHGMMNLIRGKSFRHPKMQLNHYSLNRLMTMLHDKGCSNVMVEHFFDPPLTLGAIVYFQKSQQH